VARLENHIERILGESGGCFTAVEITLRLNAEFGDSDPYTPAEIEACADKMPNLHKEGKKYCREGRLISSKWPPGGSKQPPSCAARYATSVHADPAAEITFPVVRSNGGRASLNHDLRFLPPPDR
jgi:hypothetical protein